MGVRVLGKHTASLFLSRMKRKGALEIWTVGVSSLVTSSWARKGRECVWEEIGYLLEGCTRQVPDCQVVGGVLQKPLKLKVLQSHCLLYPLTLNLPDLSGEGGGAIHRRPPPLPQESRGLLQSLFFSLAQVGTAKHFILMAAHSEARVVTGNNRVLTVKGFT